jgi:hypothetical protein
LADIWLAVQVPQFNSVIGSVQTMLYLAILGEPMELVLYDESHNNDILIRDADGSVDILKSVDFMVFLGVYFIYTIVCLVRASQT